MPRRTYLLWFSNELAEFREPEFRSVLSMLDVECRWTPQPAEQPFLEVEFACEADACAVARRTVAVKACVELWAVADTEEQLHAQLRRRLEDHPETTALHLAADTYRITVDAFSKRLAYDDKMARITAIDDVLPITGSVRLRDPELCLQLIEDYGPDSNKAPPRPLRLFFGRWLCDGPRLTITQHSLKRRTYIGNTSMGPGAGADHGQHGARHIRQARAGPVRRHWVAAGGGRALRRTRAWCRHRPGHGARTHATVTSAGAWQAAWRTGEHRCQSAPVRAWSRGWWTWW